MIEIIALLGAAGALYDFATRNKPKSADDIDREERKFILANKRDPDQSSMRRYLDHKRHKIGAPRRPGVNADILAPRNDDWWTTKPGDDGGY